MFTITICFFRQQLIPASDTCELNQKNQLKTLNTIHSLFSDKLNTNRSVKLHWNRSRDAATSSYSPNTRLNDLIVSRLLFGIFIKKIGTHWRWLAHIWLVYNNRNKTLSHTQLRHAVRMQFETTACCLSIFGTSLQNNKRIENAIMADKNENWEVVSIISNISFQFSSSFELLRSGN